MAIFGIVLSISIKISTVYVLARIFFVYYKEATKVVLSEITKKARAIEGFKDLPVTAQVSLLYSEIIEARNFRIPLAAICSALNEAGSSVTVRYLRDVLFVIRKKYKKSSKNISIEHTIETPKPNKSQEVSMPIIEKIKPSEARKQKAEHYTSSNNPLFHQLIKDKE